MVTAEEPAGFWSYVHDDDAGEGGRITRLAERIREEYSLITGGDIEIFVDRAAIAWGDQWRGRINAALSGTTFFIPVVTPRYFRSKECRREVLIFAGHAQSLGVSELLLPILYANVQGLSEDSDDEAVALVASTQYVDWRDLRLEDESSTPYRRAINLLASRLADIAAAVAERPEVLPGEVAAPSDDGSEDDDEPGVLDLIARGEEIIPEWVQTMEQFSAELEGLGPLTEAATARMVAAAQGGSAAARLTVARQFAEELSGPAERILELGTRYAAQAVDIDPIVLMVIRMAEAPDQSEEDLRSLEEFFETIDRLASMTQSATDSSAEFRQVIATTAKMSKDLRRPIGKMVNGVRRLEDAQAIINEWKRLVDQVRFGQTGGDDGSS